MNVLIVEDESRAADKLKRMLREILADAFIHGPLETVKDAVDWLENNPKPDLIFLDIHLADGHSFEIFEKVEVSAPIIFTTAYDQYAIRAFKVNSIDYLLKPISADELKAAVEKYKSRLGQLLTDTVRYRNMAEDLGGHYKSRFVTRIGEQIQTIETTDVAFAYVWEKGTYLRSTAGKNFPVDYSLEQLESLLNPEDFFRLNRQYLARYAAVEKMVAYGNGRIRVRLVGLPDEKIVLSRERTRAFKEWIDR